MIVKLVIRHGKWNNAVGMHEKTLISDKSEADPNMYKHFTYDKGNITSQ